MIHPGKRFHGAAAGAAAVCLFAFVAAQPPQPTGDELTAETARAKIVQFNRDWGQARVAYDRAAMEKLLAPDCYVQIGEQRISRQQFLDRCSTPRPASKLVRFDVDVLTVQGMPDGGWRAVIAEKLEIERTGAQGEPTTGYSLWVTRDNYREIDGKWLALSSEACGFEEWQGKNPPFPDW